MRSVNAADLGLISLLVLVAATTFVVPAPRLTLAMAPALVTGILAFAIFDRLYPRADGGGGWLFVVPASICGAGMALGVGHRPVDVWKAGILGCPFAVGTYFGYGSQGGEPSIAAVPVIAVVFGLIAIATAVLCSGARWLILRRRRARPTAEASS